MLSDAIHEAVFEQMKKDFKENLLNLHAIKLRVLEDVIAILQLKKGDIYDLEFLSPIADDCLSELYNLYKKSSTNFETRDEKHLMEKILSKNYHDETDLELFAEMLTRKANDEMKNTLNWIFAVDGLEDVKHVEYKDYVKNLQYRITEGPRMTYFPFTNHINAVRQLYKKLGDAATPDKIREIIINAYKANVEEDTWATYYINFLGFSHEEVFSKLTLKIDRILSESKSE